MKRVAFALLALLSPLAAQEKYAPMHRLTWDEYAGTLSFWRKQHPNLVHIVKNFFKNRKVRYRALEKNTGQLRVLFALANLSTVRRQLTGAAAA